MQPPANSAYNYYLTASLAPPKPAVLSASMDTFSTQPAIIAQIASLTAKNATLPLPVIYA